MTQRLLLLNGLAIFAVVCNHAATWGHAALFWWIYGIVDEVSKPNYEHLGTFSYYALLLISKFTIFAVPSFLFVTGFFIAYTARGTQSTLTWKIAQTRLKWLLIPYLIWSVVIFIFNLRFGGVSLPSEYLKQLILGQAEGTYYYIPLLCQFYFLSFVILPIAKHHWRLLLLVSGFIQVVCITLYYLYTFNTPILGLATALPPISITFFPPTIFFFTFGVVAGVHLEHFKQILTQIKRFLPPAVFILALASVIEGDAFYRATNLRWHGGYQTLPAGLYGLAFVLTFLAFYDLNIPFSKLIHEFGRRSFGIYLIHATWLGIVAHTIRIFMPSILRLQILYQPILIVLGIGTPFLLMSLTIKSPLRSAYRYLFG
ncbi:MAG: hypothetical protein BroJett011_73070 [Chloroflexota bacterium]|nr:MAG: hypothetical protein BroJett011_73070 [Chloroflexota bacterium]